MEDIRLQKFLSEAGVASRRKAEELIKDGKIKVNKKVVTELGTKVDLTKDIIEYNGKVVKVEGEKVYILLNKPIGYVTTVKDQFRKRYSNGFNKRSKTKNSTSWKTRYVYIRCNIT